MKKLIVPILFTFVVLAFSANISHAQKLYFCEQYKDGQEIGKSDVFTIGSNGGYMTCMIDLRGTGQTIGVSSVNLIIYRMTADGDSYMDTKPFDVQPDWDYIFFDQFYTFYSAGKYKVVCETKDGSSVATGRVTIKMQ